MREKRDYRRMATRRHKADPSAAALAMQMLACVLLLLAAFAARALDEPRYTAVKETFLQLTGDPVQSISALNGLADSGAELWRQLSSVEDRLTGALDQLAEKLRTEKTGDNTTAEKPEDAAESPFDYDYLRAQGYGQGGLNPVEAEGDFADLPAPEGSTFAEVAVTGQAVVPVNGLVTSAFGYRWHPITGQSDFHTGMDIAAAEGTSILAALPGRVSEVGEDEIYGKYIVVQHAQNLRTFYAHCSAIIAQDGVVVRQGERLAKVGETGTATGPHLHFSVLVDEQNTDPYWLLREYIRPVS